MIAHRITYPFFPLIFSRRWETTATGSKAVLNLREIAPLNVLLQQKKENRNVVA
jgi:hypothetical protein